MFNSCFRLLRKCPGFDLLGFSFQFTSLDVLFPISQICNGTSQDTEDSPGGRITGITNPNGFTPHPLKCTKTIYQFLDGVYWHTNTPHRNRKGNWRLFFIIIIYPFYIFIAFCLMFIPSKWNHRIKQKLKAFRGLQSRMKHFKASHFFVFNKNILQRNVDYICVCIVCCP